MHDAALRAEARQRRNSGQALRKIAGDPGVAVRTVHRWTTTSESTSSQTGCWRCDAARAGAFPADAYGYLLGQYLGDGHLVTAARVPVLRIYSCTDYPGIVDEVSAAITSVRGAVPGILGAHNTDRLVKIQSYWTHWPCVLPQHGPGKKHERPIVLAPWQQEIVDAHPWRIIRGLIHSDGCRSVNRVVVRGKAYRYPRYFFSNESRDILQIMGSALDGVGVAWRYNRRNCISIARRAAVATMDAHVGPKT